MEQPRLALYEDETDALRELVRELGGTKEVGNSIRPDLAADRAGVWLKDCLNPERQERLQPSQLFHLLKLGRERGTHGPAQFILANIGYRLTPVEPEDEKAGLQREFIALVRHLDTLVARIERLTKPPLSTIAGGKT